jgi:hypothetical protein
MMGRIRRVKQPKKRAAKRVLANRPREPSASAASAAETSGDLWSLPRSLGPPPSSYAVGKELAWDAPWAEVTLRVELPFWLMLDNTTISVSVGGHAFPVEVHGETFELQIGGISDGKASSVYHGPLKRVEDLSETLQRVLRKRPKPMNQWRKCKTVLKIASRCNEDAWRKYMNGRRARTPSVNFYLVELCRGHIPVVNGLIRGYRLATYDRFAFEVALSRDNQVERLASIKMRRDHAAFGSSCS